MRQSNYSISCTSNYLFNYRNPAGPNDAWPSVESVQHIVSEEKAQNHLYLQYIPNVPKSNNAFKIEPLDDSLDSSENETLEIEA